MVWALIGGLSLVGVLVLIRTPTKGDFPVSKFDYLSELQPDQTVPYELIGIRIKGVTPTLSVVYAGQANEPYFNDLLKMSKLTPQELRRRKREPGGKLIKEHREIERTLYPKYVILGWEGVCDRSGEQVTFSVAECTDFLKQFPDWIFDEMTEFCSDPSNFTQEATVDAEELGKN